MTCGDLLAMELVWNLQLDVLQQWHLVRQGRNLQRRQSTALRQHVEPRTFLTRAFVSTWCTEPETVLSVMLRSDLFSTIRNMLFFSPLTTSTDQPVNTRRPLIEGYSRPKALSSGNVAVTSTSGSTLSPRGNSTSRESRTPCAKTGQITVLTGEGGVEKSSETESVTE